jgi:rare lipoprotein A
MVRRLSGQDVRNVALASSVAALVAACSQAGGPSSRSLSTDGRALVNRPAFTEEAYGVSTSARVTSSARVPKGGGSFKLGSPYKVAGHWYVPREEPGYNREGTASWYGDDFHGRKTANGEIFDRYALSAAHPTLPLPSYVYVTSLENGRTILVRVNDRGPYVAGRLIDLSHASAQLLGYDSRGHARVRVRYAGRAPLNGDDRRERQFLAEQPWHSGQDRRSVASYRPPQAPIAVPQPFPEGTPGRWSPTAYRASLAGKPEPVKRFPGFQTTAALAQPPAYSGAPPPINERSMLPVASRSARAFVNVGVYRDRDNAERLRRDFGHLGPIEVAPVAGRDGGEMYRVRLGPMSPQQAQAAAGQVADRGVTGSSVVFE